MCSWFKQLRLGWRVNVSIIQLSNCDKFPVDTLKTELWKLDVTLRLEYLYCPLKHVFCSWCEQVFTGALQRVFFVHHNNQVSMPVGLMHSNERLVFIYDLLHKHHQCSTECHVMKPMKGQGLFKWHFDGICLPL